MKKPLILFVNGGRTDLQVLIQEKGQDYRVETAKEGLRAFHQALLNGGQPYQITDKFVKKYRDYDAIWENEHLYLKKWREKAKDSNQMPKILTDEQGIIQLVPAKLLRVVEKLKENYQVIKAVVFYTRRENDSQEPIAVGKILADWLKDYFRLTTDNVCHINILPNRKRIEGPDERDYPVNQDAVKIIDQTVRELAESVDKDCIACVSAAGMQDVKNLIKACVRFHFSPWQSRFMEMEVKEREDKAVEINQISTAVDSFHAREHAIALIRQGDFAGAYGAVKHLEDDEYEKNWVKEVADVSKYFGGQLQEQNQDELDALPKYLQDFADSKAPRCLLVAMRAETALLSGRIADAISLTCTFWDAAILDAIQQNLPVKAINEVENRIIFSSDYQLNSKLTQSNKPCLDASEFPHEEGHYHYNVMGACFGPWFNVMGEKVKYLKIYRQKLDKGISIDGSKKLIPRKLRNVNTHSLVKSEQLEIAKKVFVKAGFWSESLLDGKPIAGSCFLAQDLVDNLLKELGQDNVSQRYVQLIDGVCKELAHIHTVRKQ